MRVEAVIRLADQLTVEPPFAAPRFISRDQQDRLAPGIERECDPPYSIRRAKTQFLHICVARAVQRIHARPSQLRPEMLKKTGQCQQLNPHVLAQLVELRFKLIANLDGPTHPNSMACDPYMLSNTCKPASHRTIPGKESWRKWNWAAVPGLKRLIRMVPNSPVDHAPPVSSMDFLNGLPPMVMFR